MTQATSRSVLAERVNREPLLTSEELFDYFAKVQLLINDCLRTVTRLSPSIPYTVLEIGSEVVAKLQRNKSLFRRRVEYASPESDKDTILRDAEPDPKREQDAFICDCFDLGRDLAQKKDVSGRVEDMRLSRMFAERFLRAWLHQAEDYENRVWATATAFDAANVLTHAYVEQATQLMQLRHHAGLPDVAGYGLVRYVRERLAAIDSIYARVTKAYARVILKIAKANSIDDDHFLELFQFGFFGIHRANSVYDYVLNAKYVAVAKWWARQAIMYNMKASSGIIKISPSLWQHRARMEQTRYKLMARDGSATYADIARELNYTERYVESVYEHVRTAQVGTIEPTTTEHEYVEAPSNTLTHDALDVIHRLPPRDQAYVALTYGMPDILRQDLPAEDVKWHRLRQVTARQLIAEA